MSRLSRQVAYPRGRPVANASGVNPDIIPFPIQPEANSPGPVLEFHGYYCLGELPIHLVGQRWQAEHASNIPAYSCPDPMQPGILLTSRLENGVDGSLIRAVSFEEFQERVAAIRGEYKRPRAETLPLR